MCDLPITFPNRRTVAEIQANINEKRERNLLSRLVNAKNDKEVMAGWRSDLNRILQVFNVRSVGSGRQSLTASLYFQTELAMNTHVMVLDIHRNVVASQEGPDGQHRSVSPTSDPSTTECSPSPRLTSGRLP